MCFIISSFGQKDISGVYTNEAGMQIKIEGNAFIYTIPQVHSPVYSNDTLARCTYNRIDDQFIEINTVDDYASILKTLRFTQSKTDKSNDSILVKFIMPYNKSKLKIEIHADYEVLYKLEYSQKNQGISIPKNTNKIVLYIRPEYFLESGFDGQYYGRVCFNSIEYEVGSNINKIDIEIPAIDDSFFEKYYLKGEYVRVSRDKIEWKGVVFTRTL
jgi:hypothetical protein